MSLLFFTKGLPMLWMCSWNPFKILLLHWVFQSKGQKTHFLFFQKVKYGTLPEFLSTRQHGQKYPLSTFLPFHGDPGLGHGWPWPCVLSCCLLQWACVTLFRNNVSYRIHKVIFKNEKGRFCLHGLLKEQNGFVTLILENYSKRLWPDRIGTDWDPILYFLGRMFTILVCICQRTNLPAFAERPFQGKSVG